MTPSVAELGPGVRPLREAFSTSPSWADDLRTALRDIPTLLERVGLPPDTVPASAAVDFPLLAPLPYVARIRRGDPHDPLLRQVLPLAAEGADVLGFTTDPVGDAPALAAPGLLQKYAGRGLLVTTGACAVHCRYCFRRHFPYSDQPKGLAAWAPALEAIERDTTLTEVILSGGDPLSLVDASLAALTHRIDRIGHVRRIRFHTRLPIVIPRRVTTELTGLLRSLRAKVIVVVHVNHANEIDADVAAALAQLSAAGATLLNQSVLLAGVNDDADALAALSERLMEVGVTPYYLHRLDRVAGAAHFATPDGLGESLVAELRRRLPGYLVPRYVAEVAGAPHKTPLA